MLFLGEDVLGDPVQVDGWTNDNGIFTHTAGKSGEFVRVGFGKSYRILTYNGNNHITAILNSGEDNVLFLHRSTLI